MSIIRLRPYQQDAIDAVFDYWAKGGGNPLIDLGTGLGKSVVIAEILRRLTEGYADIRSLMLVHSKELVDQNAKAMKRLWPQAPMGINCAGLGRRDRMSPMLFASIASVFKEDTYSIGARHIALIDEAHMISNSSEAMYGRLLEKLEPEKVVGFTATPFRMDCGTIIGGEDAMFDDVVFSYGIGPGIRDGWLTPLISKPGATEIDVSGVAKAGGEFVGKALEAAADVDEITKAAAAEIVSYGASRKSWLVFCTGVDHAYHVRDALRALGIRCETITGQTEQGERDRFLEDFKAGRIQAITNANVLTTGFDAPMIDLIAFLRPTLSTGLYCQMCGRGTRVMWPAGFDPNDATVDERRDAIAGGSKPNCLVLDFAGNVRRHGPVDIARIEKKPKKGEREGAAKVGDVRAKTCPQCEYLVGLGVYICDFCGHEFPQPPAKHETTADSETPILSTEASRQKDRYVPLVDWRPTRHVKEGKPDSVRVSYRVGLQEYADWICPEHEHSARTRFVEWWHIHRGEMPPPQTVAATLSRWSELTMPVSVAINTPAGSKRPTVTGQKMPEKRIQIMEVEAV